MHKQVLDAVEQADGYRRTHTFLIVISSVAVNSCLPLFYRRFDKIRISYGWKLIIDWFALQCDMWKMAASTITHSISEETTVVKMIVCETCNAEGIYICNLIKRPCGPQSGGWVPEQRVTEYFVFRMLLHNSGIGVWRHDNSPYGLVVICLHPPISLVL